MDSSSSASSSPSSPSSSFNSETFQTSIVCQEIETLINELKKLRLPHKLKQYRIYRERIENIGLMNNNGDGSLASEIEKLYVKLDSSVLCGVEQCFICAADQPKLFVNNANRIDGGCFSSSSSSSSLPSMAMPQLLNELNEKPDNVDEDFKCLPIDLSNENDNKNNNHSNNNSGRNENESNESEHHINNGYNMNSENVQQQHSLPSDISDENNPRNDDDKNKISIIINKDKVQWNLPDAQWPPIPDEILQVSPSIEPMGNEQKNKISILPKSLIDNQKLQFLTETLSPRPYRKFNLDNQLMNNGRLGSGNITSYKAYKNFINNYANSASVMK